MAEEAEAVQSEQVEQPSLDEVMKEVESLRTEKEKLLNKNQELLGEVKGFKTKAQQAEEAAKQAELEKAKKAGDHEQLYKSSEAEREKLAQQLAELQQSIHQEKVSSTALKMAADMADGPNAEILADYIAKRLKYTDDGVKVLDASGELTVSSLDDLKAEFKTSPRFQSLVRGNQASGGGAPGGKGGSASPKTVDRATFNSWTPEKQRAFTVEDKGKVTDN
jgi:predicted nuclease with TOPRIM domain